MKSVDENEHNCTDTRESLRAWIFFFSSFSSISVKLSILT